MTINPYVRSIMIYLTFYVISKIYILKAFHYSHEILMMMIYLIVFMFIVFPIILIIRSFVISDIVIYFLSFLGFLIYPLVLFDIFMLKEVPFNIKIFNFMQMCSIAISIVTCKSKKPSESTSIKVRVEKY